jgi:hypothetical protein
LTVDPVVRTLVHPLLLAAAVVVAGCAGRPQPPPPTAPVAQLPGSTAIRLVARWQEELCKYVAREGDGDPAVLSETKALRSSDVLRPARITFGVLDVEADMPGRNGWDVQGVLVGKQAGSAGERYVFLVGIIGRYGYVPTGLQDIRLVGLSAQEGKLNWETGEPGAAAVERYRDTFRAFAARFPADADSFAMTAAGERITVREQRSGAEWLLRVNPPDRSQAYVIPILRRSDGADRCSS